MKTIKKKDTVVVKTGRDKGKKGEVLKVLHSSNRVLISKVNFMKRHTRPSQKSTGGVVEQEASVNMSNVQLVCPKCSQPTRVKFDSIDSGEKVRVCRKCGEMIV
jgi:large subunit ribosomal protein L24